MPKTNKRKCESSVTEKKTKKQRHCKKIPMDGEIYCSVHKRKFIGSKSSENEYGQCCFCGDLCNSFSQSCSKCARTISWYGPDYLAYQLRRTTDKLYFDNTNDNK